MGYTHHWSNSRPIDDSEWEAITTRARQILRVAQDDLGIALSEEYDVNKMPIVSEKEIRFNGYADEGHETFMITRDADEYSFCKTARKPYDVVVVALLQLLGVYAPGFDWRSEGNDEDLIDGLALYNAATGANWDHTNVTREQQS